MNCFSFRDLGRVSHWVKLSEIKTYRACTPLFKVKTPLPSLLRHLLRKISHLEKGCVWNINAVRRSLSTPSQKLATGTSCPFSVPTVHQAKLPAVFGPDFPLLLRLQFQLFSHCDKMPDREPLKWRKVSFHLPIKIGCSPPWREGMQEKHM